MGYRHGTRTAYVNLKCRCDSCKAANTADLRKRAHWRYAWTKENGLPPHVQHGEGAYNNWGCRCEVCYAAGSAKNARRRALRKSKVLDSNFAHN